MIRAFAILTCYAIASLFPWGESVQIDTDNNLRGQLNFAGSPDGFGDALACLQLTTPNTTNFRYPDDAEAHFLHVNASLDRWLDGHKYHCAAHYCGPWIENKWIQHFSALYENRPAGARLQDLFGPYIPILIPWVDTWVNNGYRFPPGMMEEWKRTLRPDVLYITVAQNAQGLLPHDVHFAMRDIPNVVVLSAGGYGHVPIPLLLAEQHVVSSPVTQRKYAVSYVGSLEHSPKHMRDDMAEVLRHWSDPSAGKEAFIGHGSDWRDIMAESRLSLTPRGFGRTSYHVAEALQMGLVPVHVYLDVPWVYYGKLWRDEEIGFSVTTKELRPLLTRVANNVSKIARMESRIRELRQSHFTLDGAMDQIAQFMTRRNGGGDLECQRLPPTIRDADPPVYHHVHPRKTSRV